MTTSTGTNAVAGVSELLPCPFCGNAGSAGQDTGSGCHYAGCSDIDCIGDKLAYDFITTEHAIAAWNRRAVLSCIEAGPGEGAGQISLANFGPRLRHTLNVRGVTLRDLAETIGVDKASASRACQGKSVSMEHFVLLWNWLNALSPIGVEAEPVEVKPWDELARDQARAMAVKMLEANGWKPGDNFSITAMLALMVDFASKAHLVTDRCGYPDCGCDLDAACGDALSPIGVEAEPVAGWHGIETAPVACTVLATHFDHEVGEWVVEIVVAERAKPPHTHWKFIDTPDESWGEVEPAAWQWRAFEDDDPRTQWYPLERGDLPGWEALALRDPGKFRVERRPLYALANQGGGK